MKLTPTTVLMVGIPLMAVLLAIAFMWRCSSRPITHNGPWPYYVKRQLLSPVEQGLYQMLVHALPDYVVFAHVQLSRVLAVKKDRHENARRPWINRVSLKSFNFVVCAFDGSVVAAIELDDKSHEKSERAGADRAKDRACASAGLRLIRWKVDDLPDAAEIESAIAEAVAARSRWQILATPAGTGPASRWRQTWSAPLVDNQTLKA